ncbi:MAG: hypothetical protein NVSMB49_22530 [Ktedonobacteraceae bacterium]
MGPIEIASLLPNADLSPGKKYPDMPLQIGASQVVCLTTDKMLVQQK